MKSIKDAIFDYRNRLLCRSDFRRRAQKTPIFQWVARRRAQRLFRLCSGFIHSQVLLACVHLALFDRVRDGPQTAAALAEGCSLPLSRMGHLLRAAAALQLLEERPDGRFGLGILGAAMVDNESVSALVRHHALLYEDLQDPVSLFRGSGEPARMAALWPYASNDDPQALPPDSVAAYTSLMSSSQAMIAEQVLDAVPMDGMQKLLDVGGGAGTFVAAAAARWPHLQLSLVDLPAVAAIARERLVGQGLGDRVDVVSADATSDALPDAQDAVSFVRILHDHEDARVTELLAAAKSALVPGGMLIIAEPMTDAPGAGPLIDAYFNIYLLAMGSGRPRDFEGLRELLQAAGFHDVRRRRTAVPLITSVIVARA